VAQHTITFPVTDPQQILQLRAGDEVTVQGHIIGIRDRTQIRIFDQGVEPPMDLRGALLLHTAPGFPDEAIEPMRELRMVYFAIVGGAAALETTQIEEIEEVAWEELMPECLWKFRVKDFGPLTVGIDAHGNSLYKDVQTRAKAKLEELYARL
jgi:L(+)-tartrate dehydratase beta subunit